MSMERRGFRLAMTRTCLVVVFDLLGLPVQAMEDRPNVLQNPLRVIAVIDGRKVVEKILRHLGLWSGPSPLAPARAPLDADAGPWTREPLTT